VLSRLLDDTEPAVRKYAVQSSSRRNSDEIHRRITRLAGADTDPRVRRTAEEQTRFS
jgi:HEAT repeat protein